MTNLDWDLDFACAVARLRQAASYRSNGEEVPEWLIGRLVDCDLHRLEQYVTSLQWKLIENGERHVMGRNDQEGERREVVSGSVGRSANGESHDH